MLRKIFITLDGLLDQITMYRLLLYYLIGLLLAAIVLSVLGALHYDPFAIVFDSLFLVAICWLYNTVLGWAFHAPVNRDSAFLTALILALIIAPTGTPRGALFLAMAGLLAMGSKYLLAINRRHIFNPAAIAVVITSFAAGDVASWWVGTAPMLAFVVIGGILLARKVKTVRMIATFLAAATLSTIVACLVSGSNVITNVQHLLLNSAVFFLAFVMLTEPFTSPATTGKRLIYATIVGALFPPQLHFMALYATPEIALAIGNLFAYATGTKMKFAVEFVKRELIAPNTYDFIFRPARPFHFEPGQYIEWTLPHAGQDSRGERRYFTIASSPTEPEVHLGIKFYDKGSTFKQALKNINQWTPFVGSRLGGTFTLPRDPQQKLAFLAGGIGITPFRSMLKYLTDQHETRPVTLLYSANTPDDFAYREIFQQAAQAINTKVVCIAAKVPVQTSDLRAGFITPELIKQEIPDYNERLFYISGPHGMVETMKTNLLSLGVKRRNIKTDFFSGYA